MLVLMLGYKLSEKTKENEKLKANFELTNKVEDMILDIDKMYKVIQEEGYFPTKGTDGDIFFKIKGTRIEVGECAKGFVYTRIYYGLDKEDIQTALYAANQVEKSYVAIKILVAEENEALIFSVESFCQDVEVYRAFIQRSISIIADSMEKFRTEMQTFADAKSGSVFVPDTCTNIADSKVLS